jgi:hypothetical protein
MGQAFRPADTASGRAEALPHDCLVQSLKPCPNDCLVQRAEDLLTTPVERAEACPRIALQQG